MKNFIPLSFILLLTLFGIACEDEEDDNEDIPIVEKNEVIIPIDDCLIKSNTFSAVLDGDTINYTDIISYSFLSGSSTQINISAHETFGVNYPQIRLGFFDSFQGDTFELGKAFTGNPDIGFTRIDNNLTTGYININGEVIICEHDTAANLIKGKFHVSMYSARNSNDTIRFTDGRFNLNY